MTEAELADIRAARGGRDEPGAAACRPLHVILAENKEKKEEAFQAVWKSMKVGKNKPLEAEDVEFMDAVAERGRADERRLAEAEAKELEEYQARWVLGGLGN